MISRPNEGQDREDALVKNDLFRKFRDYFVGVAEKGFGQHDPYGTDSYIPVNPSAQEGIMDTLSQKTDNICPIVGATGVGKTHLLLYCLKTFYSANEIPANTPVIFERDGHFDLVYYSDFTITEPKVLQNPDLLFLAKIEAMSDLIHSRFNPTEEVDVQAYIEKNKLEVTHYETDDRKFEEVLFSLSCLLSLPCIPVENIIFIFDDLESLTEGQQYTLMENFLVFFDNLKEKAKRKFRTKFIFALRNNTYANIYKEDFYNTHRADRALSVTVFPTLSALFERRFEIIIKEGTAKKSKNIDEWKKAKEKLMEVSKRVDRSYTNLLINLNNKNAGKALESFLDILSNRRWTQKNVNPAASFKVSEEDFYINDMNILRILSMGESRVYYPDISFPIRCIFQKPGESFQNDIISLLILRAFHYKIVINGDNAPFPYLLLSISELVELISSLILKEPDDTNFDREKKRLSSLINSNIEYYEENRFIHEDVSPRSEAIVESGKKRYYMLPRGRQIFDLFFKRTILFTIFRDNFFFDSSKFDMRCSSEMRFDDLIRESIKYEGELISVEEKLFKRISQNMAWHSYISHLGQWSASEQFLSGIRCSVQIYYKDGEPPEDILEQIRIATEKTNTLIQTLKNGSAGGGEWF